MRLYTLTGATALDDPEYGHFDADDQGGFDIPDDLAESLHRFHSGGKPLWETDVERQNRLIAEESARRQDPATLVALVEQLVTAAKATSEPAPESAPAPKKTTTRRAAAKADPAG